ncbi:uncharacterized protein YlxW (UPF0749 family) [Sporosarcina luteola]|nr:uncharacterized protein YlxW (UPF0749 family) [Sporosarcina luteola]
MKKKVNELDRKRGRPILFPLVFLVLGFIFAFSYRMLGNHQEEESFQYPSLMQEERYRGELIEQQERNKELADEMTSKQEVIRKAEQSFSDKEKNHEGLVEEAQNLRLLLGVIPAVGKGVRITLKDADYNPIEQNPNDYIVHESHILRVVNELRISGAQGLAINGQRVTSNSYIKCTGPVITIDGRTFPAPFVIEAAGDADVLSSALNLKGGVLDGLARENIVVTLEQLKEIRLPALRNER